MKILPLLTLSLTFGLSTLSPFSEKANAQVFGRECVQGIGSCAFQDSFRGGSYNFRTSPQYHQQRIDTVDKKCSESSSSNCNQLVPRIETLQEGGTLQKLRELQINELERRNNMQSN